METQVSACNKTPYDVRWRKITGDVHATIVFSYLTKPYERELEEDEHGFLWRGWFTNTDIELNDDLAELGLSRDSICKALRVLVLLRLLECKENPHYRKGCTGEPFAYRIDRARSIELISRHCRASGTSIDYSSFPMIWR